MGQTGGLSCQCEIGSCELRLEGCRSLKRSSGDPCRQSWKHLPGKKCGIERITRYILRILGMKLIIRSLTLSVERNLTHAWMHTTSNWGYLGPFVVHWGKGRIPSLQCESKYPECLGPVITCWTKCPGQPPYRSHCLRWLSSKTKTPSAWGRLGSVHEEDWNLWRRRKFLDRANLCAECLAGLSVETTCHPKLHEKRSYLPNMEMEMNKGAEDWNLLPGWDG